MVIGSSKSVRPVQFAQSEQELIRELVVRFQQSLDILAEPRHNQLTRQCNTILKRLS